MVQYQRLVPVKTIVAIPFIIMLLIVSYKLYYYSYSLSGYDHSLDSHSSQNSCHAIDTTALLILMETRKNGYFIPNTDHWFHFLEHIIINLEFTRLFVWSRSATCDHMYIAFQDKYSAMHLSSFTNLMLAAVFSGGRYKTVRIGYVTPSQEMWDHRWQRQRQWTRDSAATHAAVSSSTISNGNSSHSDLFPTAFFEVARFEKDKSSSARYVSQKSPPAGAVTLCMDHAHVFAGAYHLLHGRDSNTYEWFRPLSDDRFSPYHLTPREEPGQDANEKQRNVDGSDTYHGLREAVGAICGLPPSPPASSFPEAPRADATHDQNAASNTNSDSAHSSSPASPDTIIKEEDALDHIYMRDVVRRTVSVAPLTPVAVPPTSRRVIIYQRDHSRRLLNARWVRQQLSLRLNRVAQQPLSLRGGNTDNNSTDTWAVDILVHSEQRLACDLIREVNSATVLITPHGFQSMLLLFQPAASYLVEVHPARYPQPGFYGELTAALRNHLGLPRGYDYAESVPDGQCWFGLVHIFALYLDGLLCADHSALRPACRYIYRLQSVVLPTELLSTVVNYIQRYYLM